MTSKMKRNPFLRVFALLFALVVAIIIIAIGLFYYIFSISEPRGISLATWPYTFTNNFSFWLRLEDGDLAIEESGLARLDEYGLWIQVINENGQEVFSHNKPKHYPTSYTTSELISLSTRGYEQGSTIFVSAFHEMGETYTYIIGFPNAIGSTVIYFNQERLQRLFPAVSIIVVIVLSAIIFFGLGYGIWLSRKVSKITDSISDISSRRFTPLSEYGIFGVIYGALNKMDMDIRGSDKLREETECVRKEWITNITHDLKTPLSPIKGYAELLADNKNIETQTAHEYGTIILKNAAHAEKLINDLKLTYQLDSGAIPFNPQKIRLIRYLKELIIDIVNDPTFSECSIQFENNIPELELFLDVDLFRRAMQNLVINALIHNAIDTEVKISVDTEADNAVNIHIRDNGKGMTEAEQEQLFERYYRGTNTKERSEGSGLGLAIANQIIKLHGGTISIASRQNEGTEFIIALPLKN